MDFHRLADEYPLMPETELESLIIDMKTRGYDPIFPLVIFEGKILDGRNRFLAAGRAGVEPTSRSFSGDEAKAREFVQSVNEHRRHLTVEWLKAKRQERIERVASSHKNGQSTRTIAEKEGVSQTQVLNDMKVATEQGCSVDPKNGVVESKDKRERPAKSTILCDRCKSRTGPTPDCPACKELRKKPKKPKKVKTPPEAGDSWEGGETDLPPPPPTPRQPQSGKPVFDIKETEAIFGKLVRITEVNKKALDDAPQFRRMDKALNEYITAFNELKGGAVK